MAPAKRILDLGVVPRPRPARLLVEVMLVTLLRRTRVLAVLVGEFLVTVGWMLLAVSLVRLSALDNDPWWVELVKAVALMAGFEVYVRQVRSRLAWPRSARG